ncbi:MAG: UvrD-helicase domain-containing protein [Candidatus Paceibacterota bacterium]
MTGTFEDLNDKQKEAVFFGDGPLLIVAGAGSGKTKTLTSRLAYLISEKKISPERIVAITFTNKAAGEMKERVSKILSYNNKSPKEPFVGTFHSFGAGILRKDGNVFGRNKYFSIFDGDDSGRLVKNIIKNINLEKKLPSPLFFIKEISRIKNELLNPEDYFSGKDGEIVKMVFYEYEKKLQENNAFDFDDLIEKVVRIFKTKPQILLEYQKRYDYILVDEYQDINTSQYWMIKLLVERHNNINVVGDDSQSIYMFRFSDFRNFLNFERDWPGAKTVFLEQNYRSTKNIIESSSRLIAHNLSGNKKELWTKNDEGSFVQVIEHEDEFVQADFIVDKTRDFLKNNMSVGILFRTNAQSRALEQVFVEYGIDYDLFGAVSFYERKEIKDILAALRLVSNPLDQISFERMEKSFGKRAAAQIKEKILGALGLSPSETIGLFIESSGLFELIKKEYPNYQKRYENISELIYFAQQFDSLEKFLEKISLASPLEMTNKRRKKKNYSGANLMTVHLSKGLEFDVVFISGVNEGLLPHQRSFFTSDELEEERRLMYVAMTRAKKELFINFYGVPSRFLFELPPEKTAFSGDRPLNEEERFIEY